MDPIGGTCLLISLVHLEVFLPMRWRSKWLFCLLALEVFIFSSDLMMRSTVDWFHNCDVYSNVTTVYRRILDRAIIWKPFDSIHGFHKKYDLSVILTRESLSVSSANAQVLKCWAFWHWPRTKSVFRPNAVEANSICPPYPVVHFHFFTCFRADKISDFPDKLRIQFAVCHHWFFNHAEICMKYLRQRKTLWCSL